jgi:uncharacterized membrane protein YeaQ/YmgE (transglycosylase-associated protein family)
MGAHTIIAGVAMDSWTGIIDWIVIGLIAGALAGIEMRGGRFGIVGDIVVGIVGALIGGFVLSAVGIGTSGFWGTLVAAFIGACILIALLHILSGHRAAV